MCSCAPFRNCFRRFIAFQHNIRRICLSSQCNLAILDFNGLFPCTSDICQFINNDICQSCPIFLKLPFCCTAFIVVMVQFLFFCLRIRPRKQIFYLVQHCLTVQGNDSFNIIIIPLLFFSGYYYRIALFIFQGDLFFMVSNRRLAFRIILPFVNQVMLQEFCR